MQVITSPGVYQLPANAGEQRQAVVVASPDVTLDGLQADGTRAVIDWNHDGKDDCFAVYVFGGSSPLQNAVAASTGLTPAANWKRADNLTVKNCIFRLAAAKDTSGYVAAKRCHAIAGPIVRNLRIANCEVRTAGEDAHAVYCPDSSPLNASGEIRGSRFICDVRTTANRHQGPANVRLVKLTAVGNYLQGGNSGFNTNAAGSVVHANVIAHRVFATNGYGVYSYKPSGITVTNNLIVPTKGRGVCLHGWETGGPPPAALPNSVTGNVMFAAESPNAEYGDSLRPKGFLARWAQPYFTAANNTMLALGGGPNLTGAYGLQMHVPDGQTGDVADNTVMAILLAGGDSLHTAKALTLEGQRRADVTIRNNSISGNHYLLATAGTEPGCQQRASLVSNAWDFVDGAAAAETFIAAAMRLAGNELGAISAWAADALAEWLDAHWSALRSTGLHADYKSLFSGRAYSPASTVTEESLTMLDNRGTARWGLADVVCDVPSSPGIRRFEFGRLVDGSPTIDYWIGRENGLANEPYTQHPATTP